MLSDVRCLGIVALSPEITRSDEQVADMRLNFPSV